MPVSCWQLREYFVQRDHDQKYSSANHRNQNYKNPLLMVTLRRLFIRGGFYYALLGPRNLARKIKANEPVVCLYSHPVSAGTEVGLSRTVPFAVYAVLWVFLNSNNAAHGDSLPRYSHRLFLFAYDTLGDYLESL